MPINTDTPLVRPPKARDIQLKKGGFSVPPDMFARSGQAMEGAVAPTPESEAARAAQLEAAWQGANPGQTFDPSLATWQAQASQDGGFAAGQAAPEYDTPPGAFRGEAAAPGMEQFASDAMETPSRYDSDLISDITSQIDAELENKRLYAGAELDEFMSQRGMVGSSVEGELRAGLLGDLERERTGRLNELNQAAADAWAADRAGAADIGFRSAEFERELGGDRVNEERWQSEFGQSQYEWEKQFGSVSSIQERALDLQETGMEYDEAFRRAKMEIEQEQFESQKEQEQSQFEASLTEAQTARIQQYGLDSESLSLRAMEIQTRATEAGRAMDITEAMNEAEIDLRLEALQQEKELAGEEFNIQRERITIQNEQFEASLTQEQSVLEEARQGRLQELGLSERQLDQDAERIQLANKDMDLQQARDEAEIQWRSEQLQLESDRLGQELTIEQARAQAQDAQFQASHEAQQSQWAESLGLQEQEYQEQVDARKAEYSDRTAERVAAAGLQKGSIEAQAAENILNRTLEREALALQEKGIDEEAAWRQADQELQEKLETAAQKIQSEGISAEPARNKAPNEANIAMQESRNESQKELMNLGIDADATAALLDKAQQTALQNAELGSREKIQEMADAMVQAGLDAETAWRAATDSANTAMNDANNTARSTLQNELQAAGLTAEAAMRAAESLSNETMNNAQISGREAIESRLATIQNRQVSNEKQRWEAMHALEISQRDKDREFKREELEVRKWETEEQMKMRESEFERADSTERLRIVMEALTHGGDDIEEMMRDWIGKYQYRTDKDPIKPAPVPKTDKNDGTTPTGTKKGVINVTKDTKPGFKSGSTNQQQGWPEEEGFKSKL